MPHETTGTGLRPSGGPSLRSSDVVLSDGTTYTTGEIGLSTGYSGSAEEEATGILAPGEEAPEEDVRNPFTVLKPRILYAVGFDSDDQGGEFDGVVLVMENITGISGLEIWRRDIFKEDAFVNLGTIAIEAMFYERAALQEFLTEELGEYDETWMVFYDNNMDNIEDPGIYEYKVRAVKFPDAFDFTLEDVMDIEEIPTVEVGLTDFDVDGEDTIFEYISKSVYGDDTADWVVGILNPVDFFTEDQQELLDAFKDMPNIKIVENLDDVIEVLRELIAQFGATAVIEKVFKIMGELSPEFLQALVDALTTSMRAKTGTDLVRGDVMTMGGMSSVIKTTTTSLRTRPIVSTTGLTVK